MADDDTFSQGFFQVLQWPFGSEGAKGWGEIDGAFASLFNIVATAAQFCCQFFALGDAGSGGCCVL